jgi:hypothetical protein
MRNDNHAANLFATLGLGQGNATANTRTDRFALVLAGSQYSPCARPERPIARALVRFLGDAKRVGQRMRVTVSMRGLSAHQPCLAGGGLAQWLIPSRVSPAVCSVS